MAFKDLFGSAWRYFVTDGVPASGPWSPSKAEITAIGAALDAALTGAIAGTIPVDTVAHLPTSTGSNKIYLVTSDSTTANNGYWQDTSSGNVILTALNTALKGPPGLLSAASNAQLAAGSDNTVAVTPAGLTVLGITGGLTAIFNVLSAWAGVSGATTTGKYSNASGADVAAAGYAYDTFVMPAQQGGIRVTTTVVNAAIPLANYYSDNAGTVFLGHSTEFGGGGSGTTYTQHALTVPAGTRCIKVNHGTTNIVLLEALLLADIIDRLVALEQNISGPNGSVANALAYVSILQSVIQFAEGDGISFGQSDGTYGAMIDENGLSGSGGSGEGGRDNANYLLAVVSDTGGKMQVQLISRATSVAVWTTSGNSNKSNPTFGEGDIVRYFDDAGGAMIEMYVPVAGGAPKPVLPNNIITAWGDSLTESHPIDTGSPPNSWEMMLATMLGGRTVSNQGIQGQTSLEIAARQGGAPSLLTVTGNQIPASGAVTVTAYSADLLYSVGVVTGSPSLTGTLAGVSGTLSDSVSNARGGTYTFTRTTSGAVVACPANTPFMPDLGVAHAGDVQTFVYGRNNPSLSPILASLAASVGYLTPLIDRFIVGSVLNQLTETTGTAGYNGIMSINAGIQAAYPNNYLDLASPPTTDEIAWVTANYGYTLTSQDSADIANGTFPTGMRPAGPDPVHLNLYGYAIWARRFYNFIIAKGW